MSAQLYEWPLRSIAAAKYHVTFSEGIRLPLSHQVERGPPISATHGKSNEPVEVGTGAKGGIFLARYLVLATFVAAPRSIDIPKASCASPILRQCEKVSNIGIASR